VDEECSEWCIRGPWEWRFPGRRVQRSRESCAQARRNEGLRYDPSRPNWKMPNI
jgi:hypothetical protein